MTVDVAAGTVKVFIVTVLVTIVGGAVIVFVAATKVEVMVDVSVNVEVTVGWTPGLVTETVKVVGEQATDGLVGDGLWVEVGPAVGLEIVAAGTTT